MIVSKTAVERKAEADTSTEPSRAHRQQARRVRALSFGGPLCCDRMNDDQLLRYSRHILLDELGIEGQRRLLAAHALVIGAGGLGSPVALYLGTAGVGTITLVDDDAVELTNLQRQIAHDLSRLGQPKAESAAQQHPGHQPRGAGRGAGAARRRRAAGRAGARRPTWCWTAATTSAPARP